MDNRDVEQENIREELGQDSWQKFGRQGKQIVFFQGANNSPEFFSDFYERLGADFQVYVVKYPGFGTAVNLPIHSLDNYLQYFRKTIESMNLQEYTLAGFSLGAYFAIEYFDRYKDSSVKGAILISPLLKPRFSHPLMIGLAFLQNEFQRLMHRNRSRVFSIFSIHNLKYLTAKIKHSKLALSLPQMEKQKITHLNRYLAIIGLKDKVIDVGYALQSFDDEKVIKYPELGHDGFALEAESTIQHLKSFPFARFELPRKLQQYS